ncbi:MAG: hypothetical protein F8N15_00855 [Methanobacterium sp.]|nr:hypothetical protein [Methanobacterium sp.]
MKFFDFVTDKNRWLYMEISLIVLTLAMIVVSTFQIAWAGDRGEKFSYPGIDNRFAAPGAKFDISFVTRPEGQNDDYNYDFSIIDKNGNALIQHPFLREIEGEWFSSGNQLYFNDYLGSTQIDCFVWEGRAPKSLVSLTDILLNDPSSGPKQGNNTKPPETPQNSRFEMTCEGWNQNGDIRVNLTGDTWAGGHFNYIFVYSPSKRYFEWR